MIIFIEKLKNSSLEINQVYRASMHVHDVHVSSVSTNQINFQKFNFYQFTFWCSPFNLKSLKDGNIRTSFDYPFLFFFYDVAYAQ